MAESDDDVSIDIDRQRAVLTRNDRKVLVGQKEFNSDQKERNARYRIRERVADAIRDFSLLQKELSDDDLDTIFKKTLNSDRQALVDTVAFILRGVDDVDEDGFEEFLKDVLFEAASAKHKDELVTIEFEYDRKKRNKDPESARSRLLNNRGTHRDLEYLIQEGETRPLITELANKNKPITIYDHYDSNKGGEQYTLDDLIKSR